MRSPKAAPDAARAPRLDRPSFGQRLLADIRKNWILYVMVLPVLAYYLLFSYVPMAGIQLAFKKYMIKKGIWGSPWVGLKNFSRFFKGYNFWTLIWNTMAISLYSLVVGTVVPILFSVLINYVRHKRWKKTLQMVTYLPYFISNVVLVGMLAIFLGDSGLINALLQRLGLEAIWRRIWHIDLAELRPTVLVLFIMSLGNVINVGYEKVLLMQNSLNTSTSEVLSTYVYKIGLINSDYGFSTAVGLFNSLVSMVLLLVANRVAKKLAGYSIW